MSLLDDVSIVVTPNGYKAGELYAVIPVPTEGAELVTNGDFATDSDWTKLSNTTISGGKANFSNAGSVSLYQDIGVSSGLVKATFSVTDYTSGSLKIYVGGYAIGTSLIEATSVGDYSVVMNTTSGNGNIIFGSINNFTGSIDNVSVKADTSADMDVTRATAATRVDENGLVNYAEIVGGEEITNGDFATDTDWNKGTGITIGSGVALFTSVSSGLQLSQSSTSAVSGKTYKISYEIKTRTEGAFSASIGGALSLNQNSALGVYTEYLTATGAGIFYIRSRGTTSGSIDNVSVKEVTRDNVPRIDYTGGGCPHILAEPQRTNLVTYSEDFSQYNLSGFVAPIESGYLAPDGTNSAYKVTGVIGSSSIYLPSVSSMTATKSIYARTVSGTGTTRLLSYYGNTNNTFTLTEEWQRFELTGSIVTGGTNFYAVDFRSLTTTLSELIIWGGQAEEGSYATSYIPTSGSTVTRNKDVFTRDGISSLINSTEGCVFGEGNFAESNSSSYNYFASLSDGTVNNRLEIRQTSSNVQFLWRVATYQSQISTSGVDVGSNFKFAVNYSSANIKFYVNGNLIDTINTPTLWSANTLNRLAFDDGAGGNCFYGNMKQLQVYDTALTDNQLIQLTGESGTHFFESYAEMASALTYTIQ